MASTRSTAGTTLQAASKVCFFGCPQSKSKRTIALFSCRSVTPTPLIICEIHRTTLSEQIKSLSVRALFATLRCAAEHLLPTFVDIEPRPAHVTNAVSNQTTTLTTSHYQKSKSLQNLHVQSKPFDVK